MKPNKKRIRKWVEALESGKYSQTRMTLRNSGGYCCLGVACDVSEIGDWNKSLHEISYEIEGKGEEECLPKAVADWYGLECDPTVIVKDLDYPQEHLTLLNDDYGYDFVRIAGLIRDTYLEEE